MDNELHPAIVKAHHLATIAKKRGWHGQIHHNKATATTVLIATRNDESVVVGWEGPALKQAKYSLFDHVVNLDHSKDVIRKLAGWPDVIHVLDLAKGNGYNPVKLVEKYKRLPFTLDDSDEDILSKLAGRKIWWYSSLSGKIYSDTVVLPRKKTQAYEIKQIGHRRLLNFTTTDIGMRSVMVDMILKVG